VRPKPLLLASQSRSRAHMLRSAGLEIESRAPQCDEEDVKKKLRHDQLEAPQLALKLAAAKALSLSAAGDNRLVLGGDQVLAQHDGKILDKAKTQNEAKAHLRLLSGEQHSQFSAAVLAKGGQIVWQMVDQAQLTVRPLSDEFIESYVADQWADIRHCVGCYQVEGAGVQIFSEIEGSHFTIMGLPLLPLLTFLRAEGILAQ